MSVMSADGRESVSAQCLKGEAYSFSPTRPELLLAALTRWYVELLRFTPRWIKRGTSVNAAEMVRRQCPARTPLEGFFNILLGE